MPVSQGIRIADLGISHRHPVEFTIDRPRGSGNYLLLRFRSPVRVRQRGRWLRVAPDACWLYTPREPQLYRGDGVGLHDDWVHFEGPAVGSLLRRWRVPFNRPFRPGSLRDVLAALRDAEREWTTRGPHWRASCDLILRRLLLLLGRPAAGARKAATSPRLAELHDTLADLRARIASAPERPWTVASMAASVHLSPSRFAAVFARFFDQSPIAYVIDARIDRARWYLRNTTQPAKQIAAACGFQSIHYFSRVFSQRAGCSPTTYRVGG